MSWLDKLEARGAEARRTLAKKSPPRRSAVQQVVYQVRAPSAGDPGEIDFGFYVIEDDTVLTLTDINGKPLDGDGSRTLALGDDPVGVARNMIFDRCKDEGKFTRNGRLEYPDMGYA